MSASVVPVKIATLKVFQALDDSIRIVEKSCHPGGAIEREVVAPDILFRIKKFELYFFGFEPASTKKFSERLPLTFVVYHMEPPAATIWKTRRAVVFGRSCLRRSTIKWCSASTIMEK
jgi:hypothetical protein